MPLLRKRMSNIKVLFSYSKIICYIYFDWQSLFPNISLKHEGLPGMTMEDWQNCYGQSFNLLPLLFFTAQCLIILMVMYQFYKNHFERGKLLSFISMHYSAVGFLLFLLAFLSIKCINFYSKADKQLFPILLKSYEHFQKEQYYFTLGLYSAPFSQLLPVSNTDFPCSLSLLSFLPFFLYYPSFHT